LAQKTVINNNTEDLKDLNRAKLPLPGNTDVNYHAGRPNT